MERDILFREDSMSFLFYNKPYFVKLQMLLIFGLNLVKKDSRQTKNVLKFDIVTHMIPARLVLLLQNHIL